jgi:phosphatidate cytidylyltransferase
MLPVLAVLALWWVGSALYLLGLGEIEPAEGLTPWLLPTGLVVLLGLWLAVVHLHGHSERGPELVLFLMLLIWTADTAAFFTGRRWGKTKLAPIISPGKTWAGVYGALVGAAAAGLLLSWWLSLSSVLTAVAVMICVVTAFVSVVGDLYESLVKRRRGVKDSGRLLPGHGGMLDRIDSLTAAAPVFTLGVLWLEAYL